MQRSNLHDKNKLFENHVRLNHRKEIKKDLEKVGIVVSPRMIKVLEGYLICLEKDRKLIRLDIFIRTFFPGERVALDILEIKKTLIVLAIDYFTRKVFGKAFGSENSHKILDFIKEVHADFPIACLISDNGREFDNKGVNSYFKEKGIKRIYSIPHYHRSNGRIERANKTILETLKHAKDPTRKILAKVIKSYNKTFHRGIGMLPNEAMGPENKDKVIKNQEKYSEEFKRNRMNNENFLVGEKCW